MLFRLLCISWYDWMTVLVKVREVSQVTIFIWGITERFYITNELFSIESMKGTASSKDLYEWFFQQHMKVAVAWNKISSVTTDVCKSWKVKMKAFLRCKIQWTKSFLPGNCCLFSIINQQLHTKRFWLGIMRKTQILCCISCEKNLWFIHISYPCWRTRMLNMLMYCKILNRQHISH
jgi:hypothetical protein